MSNLTSWVSNSLYTTTTVFRFIPLSCSLFHLLHSSPYQRLKHGTANNKHPLLLLPDPLHNPVRALRQRGATRVRGRNSIQFEQRGAPRQGDVSHVSFVVDLEGCWFVVQIGMQFVVEVE